MSCLGDGTGALVCGLGTTLSPEGLHLGDLFAALAPDLVDILRRRPQHLLHPLLLQLLLVGLRRRRGNVRRRRRGNVRRRFLPKHPHPPPPPHPLPPSGWVEEVQLTCFSACLRRRRKRSSPRTQAGSSLWPCCLAFSSWALSSRSTCNSWSNRAWRVRDTCRSSSRSKEVRSRPSRPLMGTGG